MKSISKVQSIAAAALLLFTALVTPSAKAQVVDGVAAIVGTKTVLISDVESQAMQLKGSTMDAKTMRCEVLAGLLTQKLLVAQALLDSVVVSDEEIENELDRRIRYFANMAGGTTKLEEYYGKSILEIKEEFRDDIREQLLAQRKQQDIVKDIKATPSDVRRRGGGDYVVRSLLRQTRRSERAHRTPRLAHGRSRSPMVAV